MAMFCLWILLLFIIPQSRDTAPVEKSNEIKFGDDFHQQIEVVNVKPGGINDETGSGEDEGDLKNPYKTKDMSLRRNQLQYLKTFGYEQNLIDHLTEDEELFAAIKNFQHKWGLQETGQMNTETKNLMEQPRCGDSDSDHGNMFGNFRTHSYGGWSKLDLTYKIVNTSSSLSDSVARDAMQRALAEWSNVSPLTFTETSGSADLIIFFVAGDHADGFGFDGSGSVVAHAFYPKYGGDTHFDHDEYWTLDANGVGVDLFLVAVHEFGHALGFEHSDVSGSIMHPFYTYQNPWSLPPDDAAGIRQLYRHKPGEQASGMCVFAHLDAITSDKSGNIFIFHGENYTLFDHNGIVHGFPRKIIQDFPEISGTVDAVVYLPELIKDKCNGKYGGILRCYYMVRIEEVFVFSGEFFYRYNSGYLESKKMKEHGLISEKFAGIPDGTQLDAAFTYDGTDLYLVSGDNVWRHIRGTKVTDSGSPYSLRNDLVYGMPILNDVLSLPSTSTYYNYFFVGDYYYRTSNGAFQIDDVIPSYPRDISQYWCDSTIQNDLGFLKHHSVFVEVNGDRISVPGTLYL